MDQARNQLAARQIGDITLWRIRELQVELQPIHIRIRAMYAEILQLYRDAGAPGGLSTPQAVIAWLLQTSATAGLPPDQVEYLRAWLGVFAELTRLMDATWGAAGTEQPPRG
jgi:hypothetical protein